MMINTPNKEYKRAIEMDINKLVNYAIEKKLMQDTFLAECVNEQENEDQTNNGQECVSEQEIEDQANNGQETSVLKTVKTDSNSENQDPLIEVNLGTEKKTSSYIHEWSFGTRIVCKDTRSVKEV